MRLRTTLIGLALAATLAGGAAGCKTVYEPVPVRPSVADARGAPAQRRPHTGADAASAEREAVEMRAYTVVDWSKVGRVTGDVFEGIGIGLWYATVIGLHVMAECATCLCR